MFRRLSAAEVEAAWSGWLTDRGRLDLRDALVEEYLPLAIAAWHRRPRLLDGDDARSVAFGAVLRGVETYRPGRGTLPSSYLYLVVRRALDSAERRRLLRRRRLPIDPGELEQLPDRPRPRRAERKLARLVRRARLDLRQQTVLCLRLYRVPHHVIGTLLSITEGRVGQYLQRRVRGEAQFVDDMSETERT